MTKPFSDDGCELHPACLSCPRWRCQYDDPPKVGKRGPNEEVYARVKELTAQGKSTREITLILGTSPRTVNGARAR